LLRDDAFIPRRPANDPDDLAPRASRITASSTCSGDAALLTDGVSRDVGDEIHHWQSEGLPADVVVEWERPVSLSRVEIKCDTNVRRNILMRKDSKVTETFWNDVPQELLKALALEARVGGEWVPLGSIESNRTRLITFSFDSLETTAVRIVMKETYGSPNATLFEVRCYGA
ncbi:MAG: FAD-binding dehydrogenase, partial [Lentisphaerae bacterium]|nr:FAD-binding dehydrogenase [Lentisphaerota bacterium]